MGTRYFLYGIGLVLTVGTVSACAPVDGRGSVAVEVRAMSPKEKVAAYDVSVIGPDDELLFSQEMGAGESVVWAEVPLGWVSVNAEPFCTVDSELTSESPTMRLILDGIDCILTD